MAIQNRGTPNSTAGEWSPTTPWLGRNKNTEKYWPPYVCRNPNCKSYGRSHPNCNCGPPGRREDLSGHQTGYNLADGGEIPAIQQDQQHFCEQSMAHHPECEHHLADGGEVATNQEFATNPDLSIDHAVINHGLLHLFTKTGHTRSEDPSRIMTDHLDSVRRGKKDLETHSKNIFSSHKDHKIDSDSEKVTALKERLDDLRQNPTKALDVGGALAGSLPNHAGTLAAKLATVMNYESAIRPKTQQLNSMSEPIPPSKMEESKYNRKLALLENPALLYQDVKDGMISPDDMAVVQAVYPKLFEQMKNQTTSALIDAKTQGNAISYKHRLGLGRLLGQPLDFSASPAASQAIIRSNAGAQSPEPQQPEKKAKKASGAELKQINQVNQLSQTPIEASQIDQKRT